VFPAYGQQAGPIADDYIRDPDYFKKRNINILEPDEKMIDQSLIDWSQYPGRHFPLVLRQEPGSDNALRQVKFIFPLIVKTKGFLTDYFYPRYIVQNNLLIFPMQ